MQTCWMVFFVVFRFIKKKGQIHPRHFYSTAELHKEEFKTAHTVEMQHYVNDLFLEDEIQVGFGSGNLCLIFLIFKPYLYNLNKKD